MNIKDIFAHAEVDFKIDRADLDSFMQRIHVLHAKYWKIYLGESSTLRKLSVQLSVLKKELIEYYRGRGTEEVVKRKGEQFQLKLDSGVTKKVARDDVDLYVDTDEEYTTLKNKVDSQYKKVEYVKSLLGRIDRLNWDIKNIIEFTKIELGGN